MGGEVREGEVGTETAVWSHTGLPPVTRRWVLMRDPQGEVAPQARVSTHLPHTPAQRWEGVVRRGTRAVTCQEARAHLGLETPRQWSDLASDRTPPVLFGLSALATRMAHALLQSQARVVRPAAGSGKSRPPRAAAIALGRRELGRSCHFALSAPHTEMVKNPALGIRALN